MGLVLAQDNYMEPMRKEDQKKAKGKRVLIPKANGKQPNNIKPEPNLQIIKVLQKLFNT